MNEVLKDKDNKILNPRIPRYEKIKTKTIYSNENGTSDNINLTENININDMIRIYYKNGNLHGSVEITDAVGKRALLSLMTTDGNIYIQIAEIKISEKTISFSKNTEWWHSVSSDGGYNASANKIKITKIDKIY